MFADKFNNLLAVTGLPNNKIARELNLDPSLVSRWRKGTKTPLRNQSYLEGIARLASARIASQEQKDVLAKLVDTSALVLGTQKDIQKRIVKWLKSGGETNEQLNASVNRLNLSLKIMEQKNSVEGAGGYVFDRVYSDALKKKEAADHFFLLLKEGSTDGTLRILLDDSGRVESIYAGQAGRKDIAASHSAITTVKILLIGTVSVDRITALLQLLGKTVRNATFLFARFSQLGNQMFTHSGILAPGAGGVMSVGFQKSEHAAMIVHADLEFVQHLADDFDRQYQKSEPMNWVREDISLIEALRMLGGLHKNSQSVFFCGRGLPLQALTPGFMEKISEKLYAKYYNKKIVHENIHFFFQTCKKMMQVSDIISILPLLSPQEVERDGVELPYIPMEIDHENVVTPELYCVFLEHILQKMREYENLYVHFMDTADAGVAYYIQTPHEIIYMTDKRRNITMQTSHKGVLASFKGLLEKKYHAFPGELKDRAHNIKLLEKQIELFKEYLDTHGQGLQSRKAQ